ncbi:MAG: hypothetical protein CMJ83_03465 [Planctomycetes bacterium]|nr:hypothetical protein [Planctomycetota bacterium]
MNTRILIIVAGLMLCVPICAAQDEAVAEAMAGLKAGQKGRISADQIHFIKLLGEKWESADEKQKKAIHSLAKKNLKSRDKDVRQTTVEALPKMKGGKKDKWGDSATKLLVPLIKLKTTENDVTYFGIVLDSIGLIGHKRGIQPLTKLLKYKDFDVVAAAGLALRHYKDSDIKQKKEIVKEILKMYSSIDGQARDPRNTTAQRRYAKITKPFETSLKALTGVKDITNAPNWQRWWNNTGKKAKSWG